MNENENPNPVPSPASQPATELNRPAAVQSTTTVSPAADPVAAQLTQFHSLFTATLIALLLVGAGLDLYLLRQMMSARKDLAAFRPQAYALFDNDKKEKAAIKAFLGQMQVYASTHQDFAPIFNKYVPALQQVGLIAGTPAPAANPDAPTLK